MIQEFIMGGGQGGIVARLSFQRTILATLPNWATETRAAPNALANLPRLSPCVGGEGR